MAHLEPRFYIADRVSARPWKIGVTWPFGVACDRLARATKARPGIDWMIVAADKQTAWRQIWKK